MWFRLKVCTVARMDWFALDMFPGYKCEVCVACGWGWSVSGLSFSPVIYLFSLKKV
jgi:hypothetical protein